MLLPYDTSVTGATGNVIDQLAKGTCQYVSSSEVIKLRIDARD
jgi:hypothetical protein